MTNKRPKLDFEAIRYHATGRVDVIFPAVGISFKYDNPNRHQPCPICGGTDRFRCDDKAGTGSWICNQCGAGTGFKLVEMQTGLSGYDLMAKIGEILNVGHDAISDSQRKAWRASQAKRESQAAKLMLEQQAATAQIAQQQWANAQPADAQHPYLQRKCIGGAYLKQDADALLAPLYYTDIEARTHTLMNIRRIYPDGTKRFLKSGRQKDCYFIMGTPSDLVFIGEGVATCGAVFEAFDGQYMTVCAFNAGNLLGVARAIRMLLPSARIIFIADNDAATASGPHGENVGIAKATAAAAAVGGVVVYPILNNDNQNNQGVCNG